MFSVLHVFQEQGGYVEGVECIKSFNTQQEATDFIQREHEEYVISFKKKEDYVNQFLDKINVPTYSSYDQWMDFTLKFFGDRYIEPSAFRIALYKYLFMNYAYKKEALEGFDPPVVIPQRKLYVVEIKNVE